MSLLHTSVLLLNTVSFLSQSIIGENRSLKFFFNLSNLNILEKHLVMHFLTSPPGCVLYLRLVVLLDESKFIFFINYLLSSCYEI